MYNNFLGLATFAKWYIVYYIMYSSKKEGKTEIQCILACNKPVNYLVSSKPRISILSLPFSAIVHVLTGTSCIHVWSPLDSMSLCNVSLTASTTFVTGFVVVLPLYLTILTRLSNKWAQSLLNCMWPPFLYKRVWSSARIAPFATALKILEFITPPQLRISVISSRTLMSMSYKRSCFPHIAWCSSNTSSSGDNFLFSAFP